MSAPDVELNDGSGTIIISSEDEGLKNKDKPLKFFKVEDGTRLRCEDFLQGFSIVITITHADKLPEDALFIPTGDLKAVEDAQQAVAEPVSSGVKRKLEELGVETVGKKPKLATPASTEVMEIVL